MKIKKIHKKILTGLAVVLTIGILAVTALADANIPTVTYNHMTQSFEFKNTSSHGDKNYPNLFPDMTNLMPGDTVNQEIIVAATNITGGTASIYLGIDSESDDVTSDESAAYNELMKFATLTVENGDTEITSALNSAVLLGSFSSNYQTTLTTTLTISPKADNSISGITAAIPWVFTAQYESDGGTGGSTKHTVTYNANGGMGSQSDYGLSYGTTYTVKSDTGVGIERKGYQFVGWNTASDGTGTEYSTDDTFKISSNTTLYAQWKSASSITDTNTPALNMDDHTAYVIGYSDGTVRPDGNITRAEVSTIFFRLLTTDSRNEYWSTSSGFRDVSSGDWFNNAVSTMRNADVITGYTDGTFGGNRNITRAEFAAITARFDTSTYTNENKFSDISGHWATEYINRAAEKGWITGYSDGTFKPDQYITRAEAITLISRVLGRDNIAGMHTDMKTWLDNPSTAWYYEAVQEATNSHVYKRNTTTTAETWMKVTDAPDWESLEKSWSTANSVSFAPR